MSIWEEEFTRFQRVIDDFQDILTADEDTDIPVQDGDTEVNRPSIAKQIEAQFEALQAMVVGRLSYETKEDMDNAGFTTAALSEVWNDTVDENNGLYGWNGSEWEKSPYDAITYVDEKFDAFRDILGTGRTGYALAFTAKGGLVLLGIRSSGEIVNKWLTAELLAISTEIDAVKEQSIEDFSAVNTELSSTTLRSTENETNLSELTELLNSIADSVSYNSRSGYLCAFTDKLGQLIAGLKSNGALNLNGIEIDSGYTVRSGYLYAVTGKFGAVIFGIKTDGSDFASGLESTVAELNTADRNIVCWGDSMTAGAGSSAVANRYPNKLATKTGLTVHNCGVGGETSNTIASRSGAIPFMISIHDDEAAQEIPATETPVKISFADTWGNSCTPLLQGDGGATGFSGSLNGVKGTISYISSEYFFTRDEVGSAVSMESYPYAYYTDFSFERQGEIQIIWIGQNGNSEDDVFDHIQLLIDHQKSALTQYLVIPKPTSNDSLDEAYERKWGRRVLKIREYLARPIYAPDGTTIINSYGLRDAGLTPTAQDLTDIANAVVPDSLRVDAVHFNDYGYEILATLCAERLLELKYI